MGALGTSKWGEFSKGIVCKAVGGLKDEQEWCRRDKGGITWCTRSSDTPRCERLGRESITGIQRQQCGRGLPSGAKALAGGRSQLVANWQRSLGNIYPNWLSSFPVDVLLAPFFGGTLPDARGKGAQGGRPEGKPLGSHTLVRVVRGSRGQKENVLHSVFYNIQNMHSTIFLKPQNSRILRIVVY